MRTLLVCWIAFPLLLGLILQGCGTLVERAAGLQWSCGLRFPCGLAFLIGAIGLITTASSTAPYAVPAVVALAAVGLLLSKPWRWRLPGAGPIAALLVFAVFAAPVVMSGSVTWAGYLKLDDTASWLAVVDRGLSHGHSLAGLPPSTYLATLRAYLLGGYPIGAFLPLGLGHALLGQDNAWLVDPWMAFMAGTLALALHEIASLALGERAGAWRAVLVASFAAAPALLYGYYLWGGIKEVAAATLIATFALSALQALRGGIGLRKLIPGAVVLGAMIAALTPGGLIYVGPGLLLALILWGLRRALARPGAEERSRTPAGLRPQPARRSRRSRGPRASWALWLLPLAGAGLVAYLALRPNGFVQRAEAALTSEAELGNLIRPLDVLQVAGIWPSGDFRFAPHAPVATHLLIALAVALALLGLLLALRAGAGELVLYLLCALAGAVIVDLAGSPWVAGKALASASPAVPFAALTALFWPRERPPEGARGRRLWSAAAAAGALAIVAGIVWSNALAYHDANLAPGTQFQELSEIGKRIAGEGPTLMTEYQPYGPDDFLREADPELASGLHMREDLLQSKRLAKPGQSIDIDQLKLQKVLVYRTIVLQRSPVASRPPAPYRLTYADRFWEVWQRPAKLSRKILWQLAPGEPRQPGGVPSCTTLERLARKPGVRRLIAQPLEHPLLYQLAESRRPAAWSMNGPWLAPSGSGSASLEVKVRRAGHYSLWLGGSTRGSLAVYVDGRELGSAVNELEEAGQYLPFGELWLAPGRHSVALRYSVEDWRPGVGWAPEPLGPLLLRREISGAGEAVSRPALISVAPSAAGSLCGRTLDWVEGFG